MSQTLIHEGRRLKAWIEKKKIPIGDLLEKLKFKDYNNLYYYYEQENIKRKRLLEFCEALGISLVEFNAAPYETGRFDEENFDSDQPALQRHSIHQGEALKELIDEYSGEITDLAKRWGITRTSLYRYYTYPTLPEDIIFKASYWFRVPTSHFTGTTKPYFKDNDIWILLRNLFDQNKKMQAQLERIENKLPGK